jgi:iron complex outermembrane receptor protein
MKIKKCTSVVIAAIISGGASVPSVQAEDSVSKLEVITVTSRKRDESIKDVPVTISVFSGDELEDKRIEKVDGLLAKAPGLFVSQNQTFGPVKSETYITMRGVGATTPLEPAVAVFIDGVYQSKLAFDIGFLDLERVEILRGPQGALFGRNTQGGAISLVTKKPDEEFSGKISINVDEYNTLGVKGTLNIPLIEDKLYWSISGLYNQTDGFLKNVTLNRDQEDQDKTAWRSSLTAYLSDDLIASFTLFGSELSGGQVGPGVPTGSNKYEVFDNERRDLKDDTLGGSLSLEWELDDFLITSITGFSEAETEVFFDLDGSAIGTGNFQIQDLEQTSKSQEIRFSSNADDSQWTWLTGLYYFESTYDQARDFSLLDASSANPSDAFLFSPDNSVKENADFEREGWAGFGQVNYQINDQWEFTVGARYSSEEVTARQFGRVVLIGGTLDSPYDNTASETFEGFSPMTSLAYKLDEDVLLYATISNGFRAGGFPKYPFSQDRTGIPFENETSTNYELGMKAVLLDGQLSVNAAIYQIDIDDQQLGSQVDGPSGVPVEGIDNVGESTNKGAELELTWMPIDNLTLFANLGYIDAKFDTYIDQNGSNRAGQDVPYIPQVTANIGVEYEHYLTNKLSLKWALDYNYVDDYIVGNGVGTFDPRIPINDFNHTNVSVTLESDYWDIILYADNVTNEFNVLRTWQSPFHDPSQFSFDTVLPPRTIGLKATYRF